MGFHPEHKLLTLSGKLIQAPRKWQPNQTNAAIMFISYLLLTKRFTSLIDTSDKI